MRARHLGRLAAAIAACCLALTAHANPTGPSVVSGQAAFSSHGNALNITNSAGAIINWKSFSIGNGEITRFLQPSAASSVLNRVIGVDPSQILGTLQSNGRVFLINRNGIAFGPNAQINVNGLVASTLNMSNADFLAGRYRFGETPGAGGIDNQGHISTADGGTVYLIAPDIHNTGIIKADHGQILLAAGKTVELVNPGSPDLRVEITAPEGEVVNLGQLLAKGGGIGIYAGLIHHGGVASADTAVRGADGKIVFKATSDVTLDAGSSVTANGPDGGSITIQSQTGTTSVSGSVEAKGSSGHGGTVQILGDKVGLFGAASIDVSGATGGGAALIGGDAHGANPMVANANATYVSADSRIDADATDTGNGGKAVVWSNGTTRVYGTISARGGQNGGNGGFVETSGKQYLDYDASVDTRAPAGLTGTLLLDPTDITISTDPDTGSMGFGASCGSDVFCDASTTPSNLNVTTLTTQLGSTNVTITTASGLTGTGNITVNTPISYNSANSLTFNADNDINVTGGNAIVNAGAGAIALNAKNDISVAANVGTQGGLTLTADSDTSGAGAISGSGTLSAGTTLSLNAATGITATTAAPGISFNNSTSGDVAITNSLATGVTVNGGNSGGAVTVTENTGSLTVGAGGVGTTGGGAISLAAIDDINVATNVSTTGSLSLASSNGAITQGAPADTLSAGTALTLNAAAGIIATTVVPGISFSNSTSGDVAITNSLAGGVTVSGSNAASGGAVNVTENTGGLTVDTGGISTTNGALTLDDANGIILNGNLSSSGGNISLDNDVVIAEGAAPTISSGGGTIQAAGTISGTTGGTAENLTLDSGTGQITLNGIYGAGAVADATGLANLTIANSGVIDFNGPIAISGALTQTNAAAGVTTFDGTVNVGSAALNGTAFNVDNSFTAGGALAVTNSGTFATSAAGVITAGGGFSTTGDVNLGANISTTGQPITIGGNLTIAEAAAPTLTSGGGNIQVSGTTDGTAGGVAENLAVDAGSAGTVTFTGAVGGGTPLGTLTIVNSGSATFGGAVSANTFSASSAGAVMFTSAGSDIATLGAITAPGGFSLGNGANAITVNGAIDTSGGNGAVFITAGSYTQTGNITAGDGDVTIEADTAAIGGIQTTGNVYLLPATTGTAVSLGGSSSFDLTQGELTNIAGAGRIFVGEDSGGAVTAGAVTVGSASAIDLGSNNLTLAGTSVTLNDTSGTHGLTTAGSVTLKSTTGGVTTNASSGTDITAASLAIQSANGIGAGVPLRTAVGSLAFSNTAGAVSIANTGALTIGAVDVLTASSNTGTTTALTANGGITFAANVTSAGDLSATTTGGPITFAANATSNGGTITAIASETAGTNDDVIVNGSATVKAIGGNVSLQAGDGVTLDAGGTVQSGSGAVTLTSGSGDTDGAGALDLAGTVDATSAINLNSGVAGQNVTIGLLSLPGGTVAINSSGAIVDGNGSATNINAATANLSAATGIGSGDAIETAVANLTVTNSTSGDVRVNNTSSLALQGSNANGLLKVTNSGSGTMSTVGNISANSVALSAGGLLTVNNAITATNTASLTGAGITNAATIQGSGGVTIDAGSGTFTQNAGGISTGSGAGAILITANDWVIGAGSITTGTGSGDITIGSASGGAINLGGAGANTLDSTELAAVTTSGTFTIGGVSTGTIDIAGPVTFTGSTPKVVLQAGASGGAITDSSATAITAGNLTLLADNSVGTSASPIQTTASTVSATTQGGGIVISATAGLTIGSGGIVSNDGAIDLAANGALNLNSATPISSTGGAITLTAASLGLTGTGAAVDAGAGNIQLAPTSSAATIGFEDATQTFNITNALLNGIATTGTVTIGSAANTGNISTAGNNPIAQAKALALVTGGNINLTGANGISASALTLNGNSIIETGSGLLATTSGDLTLSAVNGIGGIGAGAPIRIGAVAGGLSATNTASGDLYLKTGSIQLGSTSATLSQAAGGTLRVDSTDDITIGGNISVGGSGTVTLGAAGNVIEAAGTVTAQNVNLTAGAGGAIGAGGTPVLTQATNLGLTIGSGGAYVKNTGDLNLLTPAFQSGGATLNVSASGALSLPGAINTGAGDLVLASDGGTLTTTGVLATSTGNISLTGSSGIMLGYGLTTNGGSIALNSPVVLTSNIALSSGAGAVLFADTIDADAAANSRTLTVNSSGQTRFDGAIGGTQTLASLTTDAGSTAINGGSVKTTGMQKYNDAVTLGADTTLTGAGITFGQTVDSNAAATPRALTIDDSGATTFSDAVGGTNALASLTTDTGGSTAINGGSAKTTGVQKYNDAVTLGADTTLAGADITFGQTVDSDAAATPRALAIDDSGTTTFSSAVGGINALASLTTDAGGSTAINGGAITTTDVNGATGAQSYGDQVKLGANTVLTGTSGTFTGGLLGNSHNLELDFSTATDIGGGTSGTSTFSGVNELTIDGPVNLTGSVSTTGAQSYGSTVTLTGATTISAKGGIALKSVVGQTNDLTLTTAAGGGNVTATGTLSGIGVLKLDAIGGDTTFSGAIGAASLDVTNTVSNVSLTGTGTNISGAATFVNTGTLTLGTAGGMQTYAGGLDTTGVVGGAVTLNGTLGTAGADAMFGKFTLGSNTTIAAGTGTADFTGIVDGNYALTLSGSGMTTFGAQVGNLMLLASLSVSGPVTINTASIKTAGAQNYGGAVTLAADTTLDSGAAAITFGSTVDGGHALTVNTSGTTTFGGAVGSGTALTSLTTNAGGVTQINGGAVTTSGAQTYNDAVSFGANAVLSAGQINFAGGAGSVSGNVALTLRPFVANSSVTVGATGSGLNITAADIAALYDGFSSITIGSSGGAVNVAVATFSDPLLLQTSGVGAINVNGPLTGTGNGSISLASGSGGIALNSPISTVSSLVLNSGGSISGDGLLSAASLSLSAASGIGAVNVPLSTNVAVLTADNSTTGDVAITNAGNVGVGVFRNQAAGGVLRLATNNGSITSGSGAVSANGGTIILSASDGGAGGNITVGAGGIVSNGGKVALHAADTITVNGVVSTGGGNAELIAGTAPGIDNTQLVDPAVESVSDDNGQIVFNAPLNAGTGNALLVAASSADAAYLSGISQSGAGAVTAGTLTAVTLHGAGGSGNGGASIALNGASNSASVLDLFACAAAGCPTAASDALSVLAPMIWTGAVNYADGAIAYSGAGSATVAGLATANDASLYLPLDLTLNAAPDARNLQLQAGRDLAIDLPQAMPALTGSGTFSFIAGRNLAYNAYAAGATFGTAAAAFPRNLNFSAGSSVALANSLYAGNLQVSAGQAANLTGNHVVSGSDITIAAPTLNVLGGAASNIMNQSGIGQQLVATGTINLAVPGSITIKAGSYNGVSDGAAIVHANTINIGSSGARAGSLTITGGSATVTGTTNHAADAAVTAAGNMNVFLAGNLALAGGSASIAAGAGSQQSATARGMLTAAGMTLDVGGNVSLTGGTAFAASGGNTADASAVLTVNSAMAPVIGGSLSLTGGTATAEPVAGRSANALSGALFTVEGDFTPQIGSNLVVQGGTANADTSAGGTPADADASAVLAAQGVGNFVIGNDFNVLGGSSVARGSGASASAIGGVSAGSVPTALTLKVTTGHDLNMQGGSENGAGAVSSAVILSSGEVQMNIGGQIGGQISGGAGSGLFDNNSGRITGRGYPITIVGNLGLFQQNGSGDAFILSGAPPADLDQLLSAVLTAVDQSKLLRSFGIENDVNLRHRDTEEGQSCR